MRDPIEGLCLALACAATLAACPPDEGGAPVSFPESDYAAVPAAMRTEPLVGTNYTHHSFERCSWTGNGILHTYHRPDVAERVHTQLGRMREEGIGSLRLIVWHMRDVAGQHWGVVPSRGGRLPEPFRSNLVGYLSEVRRWGFQRLTVSFSPQWANSPLRDNYDPERFEENWAFIRDVRALALEHGPADVRFDLVNEGAPSAHAPAAQRVRMGRYVRDLWGRWVDAYGPDHATVSVIAPEGPHDRGRRLESLLEQLGASGAPLPSWFEVHLNYAAEGVAWGLHGIDSVLTARGLDQPITIGETSYDDPAVSAAIADFLARSGRPVSEVLQWIRRAGADCEVSPPYRADAYLDLTR